MSKAVVVPRIRPLRTPVYRIYGSDLYLLADPRAAKRDREELCANSWRFTADDESLEDFQARLPERLAFPLSGIRFSMGKVHKLFPKSSKARYLNGYVRLFSEAGDPGEVHVEGDFTVERTTQRFYRKPMSSFFIRFHEWSMRFFLEYTHVKEEMIRKCLELAGEQQGLGYPAVDRDRSRFAVMAET